jgi:hypothetical protein
LYPMMMTEAQEEIDKLESEIYETEAAKVDSEIATRSEAFGRAIANAIFEWSKTDGGHEGNQNLFDFGYQIPSGPGFWTAPFFGQSASPYPLHPHWGDNRTFIKANSVMPIPTMVTRSTSQSSEYYQYFHEVYVKRKSLTQMEKNIAAWWADDPTQTASPPGHSYNLAIIAARKGDADIFKASETFAKVGMSVADAFINCWKCKYTYHSERPNPYILENIDNNYQLFWPEPPFPAFPSGHATQSAAGAIALMSIYGNSFSLVDDTYKDRFDDFGGIEYKPRTFLTIWATAEECAYSRFLGGIHTRMDNETGTQEGKLIGENVVALNWKK